MWVATSSRRGRRYRSWRSPWDLVPFRLNTDGMPSRLLGRMKEDDSCYKLRLEMPGLSKEDIRITVEDGMLVVTGEYKEEEALDQDEDQGGWYSQRYGYYNTSLLLPDDAEVVHIKADRGQEWGPLRYHSQVCREEAECYGGENQLAS